MAIADKLTELQATKTAIKTAIENKGQDLSGVPFTEYASKIDAIESGSSEDAELLRQLITRTNGPNMFAYCTQLQTVPEIDTSTFTSMNGMFIECALLTEIPEMDTSKVTDMQGMFRGCRLLTEIPEMDMRKVTNTFMMCYYCLKLVTIPALDCRSVTNFPYMLDDCRSLQNCLIKNIKATIKVGSGTSWGHLLTRESALSLCKECRTVTSKQTITFATPVYNDLETLYVKLVPITDKMRAEDDLIDEKLPFELCASTDDGAMTIASYMASKNWSIAK